MSELLNQLLTKVIILLLLIYTHELGHYLMGIITGIPRNSIKLEPGFPPNIALRDEEGEWVSPLDHKEFVQAYNSYDPGGQHVFFFLVGGKVLESDFLILATLLVLAGPLPRHLIPSLVIVSLVLDLVHMFQDGYRSTKEGLPQGDVSNMWYMAPTSSIIYFIFHFGIRFGIIYLYYHFII